MASSRVGRPEADGVHERHRQQHGLRKLGAAALQHAHRETAFLPRQAQGAAAPRSRRRAAPGRRHNAPHVRPSRAATCKPAQHALVVRGEPRERGAAFGRAQRLLERPQRVLRRLARDDVEAREIDARRGERRRVRLVRRRDPHDVAPLAPASARARAA